MTFQLSTNLSTNPQTYSQPVGKPVDDPNWKRLTVDFCYGVLYDDPLFSLGVDLSDGSLESILKKFYVKLPGSGKRTKTVGAEVPVDYDRWLAEIAASPDYPEYKTRSDIIRDCIHLGLTLRTDPRFRDVPELQHARQGILALNKIEQIANKRATVEELASQLFMTNPKSSEAQELYATCELFLTGLDDPEMNRRLSSAMESFHSRM